MLVKQTTYRGLFNIVWVEKARITAKGSVLEQLKRAKGNLIGRFKHLNTMKDIWIPKKKKNKKRVEVEAPPNTPLADNKKLVNFPEEWSAKLTYDELQSMQKIADSMSSSDILNLFRQLENNHPIPHFTLNQQDALRAMLEMVKSRYGCPIYKTEDTTVQLHLDYRCLLGGRKAQDALLFQLAEAAKNNQYLSTSFSMAGVIPRSPSIKLDVTIRPDITARLFKSVPNEVKITSIAVEISQQEVIVKGVLSQLHELYDLYGVTHIIGNDIGLVNTCALAMIKLQSTDKIMSQEQLEAALKWNKKQAREYLETHTHDSEAIEEHLFSGRHFLKRIQKQALHIDALRCEIDRIYNRMRVIKTEINMILGQPADTQLDLEMKTDNKRLAKLLKKFNTLFKVVENLKQKRRGIYKSVAGLKKSWFGYVSTKIVKLCLENNAAYAHENLSILAKEKFTPEYKGKTFNKMMNICFFIILWPTTW
jgi:hypothetical protein